MQIGILTWQIGLAAAMAVLVICLLFWGFYRLGASRTAKRDAACDERRDSIFGKTVVTAQAERGLIQIMYGGVIVLGPERAVEYASPVVEELKLIDNGRLISEELIDMLNQTTADGVLREREIECDRNGYADPAAKPGSVASLHSQGISGLGVQPGTVLPSKKVNLRVRVGRVAGEIYAILIQDTSEQRSFERMRRDFVTNVSHELKTPAGAIALLAETVSDASDDPDAVRYFSGRISKESERLTGLVGRLIELQKAEETLDISDDKQTNVLDTVADAIRENLVQAESKQIEIMLSMNGQRIAVDDETHAKDCPSPVLIVSNADALKTAVKNLVENAIRYSPVKTHVAVGIVADDQNIRIKVVDQGIGIPERSLSRVFERFYRVDPARSRETGGTGLGLSITKHCVQECGGTIAVWSREGEGSTFTITLPRHSKVNDVHETDVDAAAMKAAKAVEAEGKTGSVGNASKAARAQ
ncbi:MAG: ATP-binding protein [Bifidobacterium aquikefiri]|uniref:Sensor-like histidine kinase SenX3 n=1 Tax=Bifidobacterium aquikefiri TaxID=1653207 RepID=A0A261G481_9BIFI|nr:ATP-binding protein [Bifidobacterium aquikefiri]OZG65826.1 two-component system sensor histidine kinase [Bifidobacterium aquikefiri]